MQRREPVHPRWHIRRAAVSMAARGTTALFGSYAAAAALATLLARLLPVARVEATLWAMILGFAVYTVIALWCFHEPRLARVAVAVWGIAMLAGGAAWWLGVRG